MRTTARFGSLSLMNSVIVLLPLSMLLLQSQASPLTDPATVSAQVDKAKGDSSLDAICNMVAGEPTIKLVSYELVVRISVYAPIEIVGGSACRRVHFSLTGENLGRRFERLMKQKEDASEYVFLQKVRVDGIASYDEKEDVVRLDVEQMAGLPEA